MAMPSQPPIREAIAVAILNLPPRSGAFDHADAALDVVATRIEQRRDAAKARADDMTLADAVGWSAAIAAHELEEVLAVLRDASSEPAWDSAKVDNMAARAVLPDKADGYIELPTHEQEQQSDA